MVLGERPGPEFQVVTATFHHHAAQVLDLYIADLSSPIGTTPNHPFWSEDQQTFVRADELKPGERLRNADGTLTSVQQVFTRPGTSDVFNLEVQVAHTYHVAANGVLVHNGKLCPWDLVPDGYLGQVKSAFKPGTAKRVKLTEDMVVYRHHGGGSEGVGHWLSAKEYTSGNRARRYLALPDNNPGTKVQKIIIRKNTEIIIGKAANQKGNLPIFHPKATGGGIQIYAPNLDDLIPIP